MRLFAKWSDPDIPTSELYPMANELGVTNPSELTSQLEYGRVLVRPPWAESRVFRFTNAMFKRYVNLRGGVYKGVRKDVDELWAKKP